MSMLTQKPPAIWRVTDKMSPIHQEDRGTYLQVATPNSAQRKRNGEYTVSFQPPYALEPDHLVVDQGDIARILAQLSRDYELRPL